MKYLLNPDSNKKRPCKIFLSLVAITTFALGASVFADTNPVVLSPDSGPAVNFDVSTPLRDMRPPPTPIPVPLEKRVVPKYPIPKLITSTLGFDPFLQAKIGTDEAPPLMLNFEGVGLGFTGPDGTYDVMYAPSDSNSDVGPNHIVEVVNVALAIFDKAGNVLLGPIPINTIFSGFGGNCEATNDGDPVVKYDKLADRWIISQIIFTKKPYMQCVAVSRTGDPTGAYARYSFQYRNSFDYSKIGVWPDAYYITSNIFKGNDFLGGETCAYDRQAMLNGANASQQCFQFNSSVASLLPSDFDGRRRPPFGSPNYLINLVSGALNLWKFHVDWLCPEKSRITGPTKIAVAPFALPCGDGGDCIPQSETTQLLDSLGDRLMYRLSYRNFGDHESLVVNHSVAAGRRVGIRWYEIRSPNIGTYVFQQGTFAPDDLSRWMGSVAMDGVGNIGMGYSISGASMHPGIRYTGHATTDKLGVMGQGEGILIAGEGSQTGGLNRWGDYSSISVDPVDDCTFWYTNQYLANNGSFNWHTRIGSFKMPGCP